MDFYLLALLILLLIAVLDLSVGVANDAVNFLNSAVGSRAASLGTLTVLAAVGLICGSMLSSGMMEVARSGIFQPAAFSFHDVMIIFVAVMVADVLLLDAFNTLGLPTSTTVSVVFELLGAAFLVALLKLLQLDQGLAALGDYLNAANALRIVAGIFLSIGVAFLVGALVQWLTRLLFTFAPQQQGRWLHALWAAFALAVICHFLLIKALAQSGLLSPDWLAWSRARPELVFALLAFGGFLVAETCWRRWRLEPTRLVVLVGTLALATAFASNDLVNFLGVPLAGLTAYGDWVRSGVPAEQHMMGVLTEPVRGQTALLLAGGVIMALTLWLSSKARSVTETEVSLARQGDGSERFRPGPVSRGLLRLALLVHGALHPLFPEALRRRIDARFSAMPARLPGGRTGGQAADQLPAFDLVRGSVNLTVASSLIALATLWKLPLSTTFVGFMVAMGTSLADRAWGRDSAVFRIAGVVSVISGWFLTALIAFLTAALFAAVLWFLQLAGLLLLIAVVVAVLRFSARWHHRRLREEAAAVASGAGPGNALAAELAALLQGLPQAAPGALQQALQRCQRWRRERQQQRRQLGAQASAEDAAQGVEQASATLQQLRIEEQMIALLQRQLRALLEHQRNLHAPLDEHQQRLWQDCVAATATALQAIAVATPAQHDHAVGATRSELPELTSATRLLRQARLQQLAIAQAPASARWLLLQLSDDLQDLLGLAAQLAADWRSSPLQRPALSSC